MPKKCAACHVLTGCANIETSRSKSSFPGVYEDVRDRNVFAQDGKLPRFGRPLTRLKGRQDKRQSSSDSKCQ